MQIPAYRVTLTQNGQRLGQKVFSEGPTNAETALLKVQAPSGAHIAVRQKTYEGGFHVTARDAQNTNNFQTDHSVGEFDVATPQGAGVHLTIEALPQAQWAEGTTIDFNAPKVEIVADSSGWTITMTPTQRPCIATVAVDKETTKDEEIPSFPFPNSCAHLTSASWHLPRQRIANRETRIVAPGDEIRLGVRGAGLSVKVKLPEVGQTVEVAPSDFEVKGAADMKHLTEQAAQEKYNEKCNILTWA